MTGRKIIDLNQELADLFRKEQMLAYFEFLMTAPGASWAGLCKISRLKEEKGKGRYFSLLLLVDTPADGDWAKVNSLLDEADWNRFREILPGVEKVVVIPYASSQSSIHLQELYLYVDRYSESPRPFVAEKLCPAFVKITGFTAGLPVFWEELPAQKPPAVVMTLPEPQPKLSLIERIKTLF